MSDFTIEIPEEILMSSKIPRQKWQLTVKQELALQLYREGIVPFANARQLAGMSKIEFHFLLGERQIPRQYDIDDYEKDLENLSDWDANSSLQN